MSKLTNLSEIADLADKAWINGSFKAIVTRAKAGSAQEATLIERYRVLLSEGAMVSAAAQSGEQQNGRQ